MIFMFFSCFIINNTSPLWFHLWIFQISYFSFSVSLFLFCSFWEFVMKSDILKVDLVLIYVLIYCLYSKFKFVRLSQSQHKTSTDYTKSIQRVSSIEKNMELNRTTLRLVTSWNVLCYCTPHQTSSHHLGYTNRFSGTGINNKQSFN